MTTTLKTDSATKNWAIAGLIISWATFWMFLLSPFGFIAWIGILIYLISKKSHLKWYLIFSAWVFVPGLNFLTGTVHYFTGTASLRGVGGPETYHGIDRDTRVKSTSSGCIFVGFEPFVFAANNAAIRLCTNAFGYQRGAYTGIYPTEEEAREVMKGADTLKVIKRDNYYEFVTVSISLRLDTLEFYRYHYYGKPLDKVIGRAINNECFIFQRLDPEVDDEKAVYIVDIKDKRLLAQYFD